jgi:hypothetical protein
MAFRRIRWPCACGACAIMPQASATIIQRQTTNLGSGVRISSGAPVFCIFRVIHTAFTRRRWRSNGSRAGKRWPLQVSQLTYASSNPLCPASQSGLCWRFARRRKYSETVARQRSARWSLRDKLRPWRAPVGQMRDVVSDWGNAQAQRSAATIIGARRRRDNPHRRGDQQKKLPRICRRGRQRSTAMAKKNHKQEPPRPPARPSFAPKLRASRRRRAESLSPRLSLARGCPILWTLSGEKPASAD